MVIDAINSVIFRNGRYPDFPSRQGHIGNGEIGVIHDVAALDPHITGIDPGVISDRAPGTIGDLTARRSMDTSPDLPIADVNGIGGRTERDCLRLVTGLGGIVHAAGAIVGVGRIEAVHGNAATL